MESKKWGFAIRDQQCPVVMLGMFLQVRGHEHTLLWGAGKTLSTGYINLVGG